MLIIISPAKTLDYQSPLPTQRHTQPALLNFSEQLITICQQLSPDKIASMMKISDKLAGLNAARFAQWHPNFTLENARQAIFAFKGDVYSGLNVDDFSQDDLDFAQTHLAILSGLYGILRPLDLMQPYRLEMGTKLANPLGETLYQFWAGILTDHLNKAIAAQHDNVLINLASEEYYKALEPHKIDATIIKPVFLDRKGGEYKIISFYAKKARGLMSRFIIKNRLTQIEQLKAFNLDGYFYVAEASSSRELVFKRD